MCVPDTGIKVAVLDKHRYACGKLYFEEEQRPFPSIPLYLEGRGNSSRTWVVHNNWIVSYEAKVYRFKEHFMWLVDTGGRSVKTCL
jgi:arabinosyltransferase